MNKLMKNMIEDSNETTTDNDAKALLTSNNEHLDLFFQIGSQRSIFTNCISKNYRKNNKNFFLDIINSQELEHDSFLKKCVYNSYKSDPKTTFAIVLYTRDIKNGLGERDTVLLTLIYLSKLVKLENNSENIMLFRSTLNNLVMLGRFDDVIKFLFYTELYGFDIDIITDFLKSALRLQFRADIESLNNNQPCSLLAKWIPSTNTSNKLTRKIGTYAHEKIFSTAFDIKYYKSIRNYRKTLSLLRKKIKIIENNLRIKDYENIDYSTVPSLAMKKYTNAFSNNDNKRFNRYLESVSKGEAKINTGTLTPFDIARDIINNSGMSFNRTISPEKIQALDAQWNALPNIFDSEDKYLDAIVAADVSGSMYDSGFNSISCSLGLAVYIAQRNKGKFHNYFIDFCENSKIHQLKEGSNIVELIYQVARSSANMSTNIDSVFKALIETSKKHNLKQKDLPKYVIIISDMEFNNVASIYNQDQAIRNFEHWKKLFEENGYKLPTIVFWCPNSSMDRIMKQITSFPALAEEKVVLISGRSQNAIKALSIIDKKKISNTKLLAIEYMIETLEPYKEKLII